ncbi:hypothetical protein BpHYR1_011924 [Brachionus plicatilis]|uniref:Uncharacterized protein n=1 Tax=Brachionus plicatilis TaxID=10195 RepID=A0A3M7R2R4_BRAPC|nr:hypothetical protein BpHYR1_011924 [Brachionus plicatilis]
MSEVEKSLLNDMGINDNYFTCSYINYQNIFYSSFSIFLANVNEIEKCMLIASHNELVYFFSKFKINILSSYKF